ncbi:MFS transporter [Simiduia agarivorans]|uniref:Major facilitator superfamily protein n=1 Tax=Simiduia agarivorans (strain DSM 21679 / JCM 13881 / BCRC 17597 / SA1) TaxID=1117647 RepID=K4L297_SIMAS|nr:MFS transporter [Simiduia agarivorans]AFV00303.1 major facilitator superfamily protein [Simiduia agarivorans SA1 = DSM 21679]
MTHTARASTTNAPATGRWRLAWVLMVSLFIGYLDRLNISLALPLIAEEFAWSTADKQHYGSLLMSLFYLAYGAANILLTPLGARFGAKRSLQLIVVLWSVFTAMGAWFSQILVLFLASRVLLGLAEGIHFPMMNTLTQRWFAPEERSRANGIWISGIFLAILTAPLLLVPIMDAWGWRAGFHGLAVAGLLITLPLISLYVQDAPPGQTSDHTPPKLLDPAPWRLLAHPSVALMLLAGILNNMLSLGISNWLPTYFASRADVDYAQLTWIAALPYVFSLLGLALFSWLGDRTGKRGRNAAFGFVAAGLCVTGAFSADDLWLSLALFCAGVFFITTFNACEFAMVQYLLPERNIAQGSGLYNGLSVMIGGGLGTWFVGQFMADANQMGSVAPLSGLFVCAAAVLWWLGRRTNY